MQISGYPHLKSLKSISDNTKWIPVAPDDILVLWSEIISLCKKLNIIYSIITCNPEPRADGSGCCSVHEWIILLNVEPVHQIWLNRLKPFVARAAQIYKLLNLHSLPDAWQSLK